MKRFGLPYRKTFAGPSNQKAPLSTTIGCFSVESLSSYADKPCFIVTIATLESKRKLPIRKRILLLVGKQMAFGARNHLVWLGMPDVMESRLDEGGANKPVAPHKIEWRTAKGPWSTNRKGCLGKVRIVSSRTTKPDTTHGLPCCPMIFPWKQTNIQSRERWLDSSQSRRCFYRAPPIKGVNATVQSAGKMHAINISVEEERPAELFPRSLLNGGECELPVSCPTNWIGLIDAAGREISREKMIRSISSVA